MYDVVHLEISKIKFIKVKKSEEFIEELNKINNFDQFFDKINKSEIDEIEDGDYCELTYDNKGLTCESIKELMKDLVELCEDYGCLYNAKVAVYDDGYFLLYLIIIDNKIYDISDEIHKIIRKEENKIHKLHLKINNA